MDDEEVWRASVDNGTFLCRVVRAEDNPGYAGVLTVSHMQSGEVLLTEGVSLSFQAIFGPDVADVIEWQERSIEVIDEWLASHPS